ncbi:hypothetical protein L596_010436 [Steinernema carpocapsae]|nr:hypothetical protein L596_010436 [Steinernema carpocapsae]
MYWHAWSLPPECEPTKNQFSCKVKPGNGTLKIMAIGNSYCVRAFPAIYEILKDHYKTMEMVALGGWEPLDKLFYPNFPETCPECYEVQKYIRMQTADILFIVNRFFYNFRDRITGPFDKDEVTQRALKELQTYSKYVKKIFISGVTISFLKKKHPLLELNRRLHLNQSLDSVGEYPYRDFLHQQANTLTRIRYILTKCPKCVFYDMQAPLCDGKKQTCYKCDQKSFLAYYNDSDHLSNVAIEKLIPSLRNVIEKMVNEI